MRTLKTCALFLIAFAISSDAASTHAQTAAKKKLRVGVRRDVDDSDVSADVDGDDESAEKGPAPAPAAAAAPGPALTVIKEDEEIQMRDMMEAASDMLKDHGVSDVRTKHKQDLAGLMWIEETLEDKLDSMNDEAYRKQIEKEEKPVADETSPGLADMLGEMREDMHEYALPFYKKVLKAKIEQLQKEQHQLVLSIADDDKEAEKKEEKEPEIEEKQPKKQKEEIEEPAPAPVKKSGKSVGNNTLFIAATAVAILAALAFLFSRRSTQRGD